MMIRAVGADPSQVGFHNRLLRTKHKKLYRLFDGRAVDGYERSDEARDEQLLAFLAAWRGGTRGPLMSYFEADFLPEAAAREDDLRSKFLGLYEPMTVPQRLRKRVLTLYERALPR